MRLSPIRLLNRISALYIVLFCFVPPIQVGTIYRVLAVMSAVVWLLTALRIDPYFINGRVHNFIIISVAGILLMFLWRLNIHSSGTALAYSFQPIIIALIGLIAMHSFKNDTTFLEFVFTVVLALVCFYCVTTIIGVIEDPYASRIANSEWLEDRFEDNEDVGLYGYVYMCVFLIPALQYKITHKISINKIADLLSYVALILITVMVLLAGYMIAIFCTMLGVLLIWLLGKPSAVRTALSIIVLLTVLLFYNQIIQFFIKTVDTLIGDNPVYNIKLDGLEVLYEQGNVVESTWYGRIKNYTKSLTNIINYPILGCYFFGDPGGGGHSEVLDVIGRYGWIAAFLHFTMLWKYPRRIVPNGPTKHVLYKVTLIMMVLYGIFDPYAQEIGLPLFLMIPYIVFTEREQAQRELEHTGEGNSNEDSVSKLPYRR